MNPALPAMLARQPADDWERRHGVFGGREIRQLPVFVEEVRDSGAGGGQFTVRGHAAIYDSWSLDLGGFKERIAPGAFDEVLARNPDVWLLWDHNTRYTLARSANKTLELRADPRGLHYWARVAPTSYANDLRILMERGDINQSSFAFTVKRDTWEVTQAQDTGDEIVTRTINEVADLYDATITAMGAYPATDSQVVRSKLAAYMAADPDRAELFRGSTILAPDTMPEGDAAPLTGASEEDRKALLALRARSRRARLLT